jgi:hypothetical protein
MAPQVAMNDNADTTYPFLDNNLDVVSLTTLLAVGAVIYGLSKRSYQPFCVAAAIGFINVTRCARFAIKGCC